jgi:hypothetical protein
MAHWIRLFDGSAVRQDLHDGNHFATIPRSLHGCLELVLLWYVALMLPVDVTLILT